MLLSITNDILEQNKIVNVWHRQSILFAVGKLKEASDQLTTGRSDSLGEVQAPVVQFFVLIVALEEGLILFAATGNRPRRHVRHFHFVSAKGRFRLRSAAQSVL
jgi:hypothetical protein